MAAENNPQLPNSLETAAAAIADRCAGDPDWMAKFKADPRRVLEDTVGRKLPSDLQIHLHQNDDDNWHVPIAGAGGKLRDSDLQKIAGGEVAISVTALAVFAGSAAAAGAVIGGSVGAGIVVSDKKKKSGKK